MAGTDGEGPVGMGHTSVILALKEAEAGESQVLGQPGLHKEILSQNKQERRKGRWKTRVCREHGHGYGAGPAH